MEKCRMTREYTRFTDYVRENIKDYIAGITPESVDIIPVVKNNQVVMDALQITDTGRVHTPLIYLENFYEDYCLGTEPETILERIAAVYEESIYTGDLIEPDALLDFSRMRDRITLRLINAEKNSTLLESCPHRLMEDLAVTYRILAGKNHGGISTVLISDSLLKSWGIDEEMLHELACENSLCLFPPVVESLHSMMNDMFGAVLTLAGMNIPDAPECPDNEIYVLTNESRINGASVLCYSDALQWFGKKINSDFYVLPSSIHEVLLLSEKSGFCPEDLKTIVEKANKMVVLEEEILSDNVYFYSRDRRELKCLNAEAVIS